MDNPGIIFIAGVTGSGKTTIGVKLATQLRVPFFDADDFHSSLNREKMHAGIALTDADRLPWLQALHQLALEHRAAGAVIACSALKAEYRELLQNGLGEQCRWIWLQGNPLLLKKRMEGRSGHFMPVGLLPSQLAIAEAPESAFCPDISQPVDQVVTDILAYLQGSLHL